MTEQTEIMIRELSNTWGCVWVDENGKTHYGFEDCPVSARTQLWLECVSGYAVEQLLSAGLATITKSSPGAYGGEEHTVRVNIAALNATCDKYWDNLNARGQAQEQQRQVCHYCGQPASKTGFFGEATCRDCS